jgi:hypothetical protein
MYLNYYYQNVLFLHLSDEAEVGSGGDQPARNSLTEGNGKGGHKSPPLHFFHSNRLCLKKRIASLEAKKRPDMIQKNELKNQLLTRKKVNVFQDKTFQLIFLV